MKYYLMILSIGGIMMTSCSPGFVGEEPTYNEVVRPQRPGNNHVWVDGDWTYKRRSHTYVRRNGYWMEPRTNKTFVPGHWQSSSRGHSWSPNRWR